MHLADFAATVFATAHLGAALAPPAVVCKKLIDITTDDLLPAKADGTPYTRAELYDVLAEMRQTWQQGLDETVSDDAPPFNGDEVRAALEHVGADSPSAPMLRYLLWLLGETGTAVAPAPEPQPAAANAPTAPVDAPIAADEPLEPIVVTSREDGTMVQLIDDGAGGTVERELQPPSGDQAVPDGDVLAGLAAAANE